MKNIKRNVIFSAIGYALPLLAALVTIPIMLSHFGPDLYGLYIICISLIGFMTLVDLGVGQTIIKYVSEFEVTGQQYKVKPVLDISLLIYLALGLLSAGLLYGFASPLASTFYADAARQSIAREVLQITALPLFMSFVNQFFLNVCKAYHRFDIPAVIQNVGNLGGIILASILLLMGYSIREVMWGYVFIYGVAFAGGYLFSSRILPAGINFGISFDRTRFKEIVSFSFYTFVTNLLISLSTRADKLFIGAVIGTEAVTFYQIPYTIAQMANGIIHALAQITFPRFSELFSLNNKHQLLELYKKTTIAILFLSMLIAVMLITAGGSFLKLWLGHEMAAQITLTLQIVALFFFFHSNTVVSFWTVQSSGNARLIAVNAIICTIAYFMGIYLLGTQYSYNGVAVALFFYISGVPIQFLWISRHLGHSFLEFILWELAFAALGVVLISLLTFLNTFIANAIVKIMVDGGVAALLLAAFLWLFIKQDKLIKMKPVNING